MIGDSDEFDLQLETGQFQLVDMVLNFEIQILGTVLLHPLYYARKLIQIGYEPLPPTPARLYFIGPRVLILPNMFSYVNHIYNVDGLTGCYRGLIAVLCYRVSESIIYHVVIMNNLDSIEDAIVNNAYFTLVKWDMLATIAGIFFSHPFYVLSNKQMASFVGHEIRYNGIIKGLYEIAVDDDISGWFSGFMPKLIAHMTEMLVFYTFYYIIHKYIISGREYRNYISTCCAFISSSMAYPYYVISACMSVNGSQLMAGLPPFVPYFQDNWFKCYKFLYESDQMRRGESIFWRLYIPPYYYA